MTTLKALPGAGDLSALGFDDPATLFKALLFVWDLSLGQGRSPYFAESPWSVAHIKCVSERRRGRKIEGHE
jgi:hypothetical protein